ncbi:N-acetylated-alpha-linked acidic dipeptidase 2-like [Saccoglossus kowalevskii]
MTTNNDSGGGKAALYSRWDPETDNVDIAQYKPAKQIATCPEWCYGKRGLMVKIFVAVLIFFFGLIIGYMTRRHLVKNIGNCNDLSKDYEEQYGVSLNKDVSVENLDNFLWYFSNVSHPIGSEASLDRDNYITNKWTEYGFTIETKKYNPWLPLKSSSKSTLSIVSHESNIFWTNEGEDKSGINQPFIAYSHSATVIKKPVYLNYGTKEDFDLLEGRKANLPEDKIVIMRFGKIFPGNMVKNAEDAKAAGVLLFSDSVDFSPDGRDASHVYPNTWWVPSKSVKSGTAYLGYGDPLTPGIPSVDGSYFLPNSDVLTSLPKIPVQVISYEDARTIMCSEYQLDLPHVPPEWSGERGCQYNGGPGFLNSDLSLKLEVHNPPGKNQVSNILASVPGSVEPDRYVIIGSHKDAWNYGGIDGSSGMAVMMELSRIVGDLLQAGWKPRRTIIFASWDAKEYGMIGSTEWVEEFSTMLGNRAVAYINLDAVVMGDYSFAASASPLLQKVIFEATKKVMSPSNDQSVYDKWIEKHPSMLTGKELPMIDVLGGTGDYLPFMQSVGVPSMELMYKPHPVSITSIITHTKKKLSLIIKYFVMPSIQLLNYWLKNSQTGINFASYKMTKYPAYNTVYDDYHYAKRLVDPELRLHQTMTKIFGEVLLELTDSMILPFSVGDYAVMLQQQFNDVLPHKDLTSLATSVDYLNSTIAKFVSVAMEFEEIISSANHSIKVWWRSYPGYGGVPIQGMVALLSRVWWLSYLGYGGSPIKGIVALLSRVWWLFYPGYGGSFILGMVALLSRVWWLSYLEYGGSPILGIVALLSWVLWLSYPGYCGSPILGIVALLSWVLWLSYPGYCGSPILGMVALLSWVWWLSYPGVMVALLSGGYGGSPIRGLWWLSYPGVMVALLSGGYGGSPIRGPYRVRDINDRLMQLERHFIRHDINVPQRNKQYKHVLLSPSSTNLSTGTWFGSIIDSVYYAHTVYDPSISRDDLIQRQLSLITLSIQAATNSFQDALLQ